eukprot:CAMPEP_0171065380 /NCGR_PEP_ID=MMETSP0766_2-20121228/6808_1 /TAXON_ID=439317 /ORGANISM="Gambierdiscus australes, Strain CAWD 149" /LENGTH=58 /DNA_ID=CAMNT_0011521471 /DNA_START=134 /DNA_END=310 /DNA_ORIENTATION=+
MTAAATARLAGAVGQLEAPTAAAATKAPRTRPWRSRPTQENFDLPRGRELHLNFREPH